MDKVKEKFIFDESEGKIIHKKEWDISPEIQRVKQINEVGGINGFGSDYKFVGSVPFPLLKIWLQEAGVAWDDTHAVEEVMTKKLMSGEYDKLTSWKGKF